MYLALPVLFLFVSRVRPWRVIALWWGGVGLWYLVGLASGMLPLSEGAIRSPAEALLKFTRFVPCFLPGLVAYKLWSRRRVLPAWLWPAFLILCCCAFLWLSGKRPIETGWFICFGLSLSVPLFQEMPENAFAWLAQRIARYSYGIYLVHYFALWVGFVVCKSLSLGLQIGAFFCLLVLLPVVLYHTVEAPLISQGVRISEKLKEKLKNVASVSEAPASPAERAPQTASEFFPSSQT